MDADRHEPATDIVGSVVLLVATAAALLVANSALYGLYKSGLDAPLRIGIGTFALEDNVKGWIKNALMAVFFLYVGLEIKAEFTSGALSDRRRAALPFIAALGGIVVPSLIYLGIAGSTTGLARGWAIPSATDIAFAIGVVAMLGRRVPPALTAFLLAVAVIDDLAAILIIAVFYTGGIDLSMLAVAILLTLGLFALNRVGGVKMLWPYLVGGVLLWLAVRASGINPTLAGVVAALAVPIAARSEESPLHHLAERLGPIVTFAIMPLFAFANAGVSFKGMSVADLTGPLAGGIAAGLLIGKPVGILLASLIAVRSGVAALPAETGWRQMAGASALAGIGFTMSLFIGVLAFGDGALMDQVRIGVLAGSLASALIGVALLVTSQPAGRAA